jgi:hypothetical protein
LKHFRHPRHRSFTADACWIAGAMVFQMPNSFPLCKEKEQNLVGFHPWVDLRVKLRAALEGHITTKWVAFLEMDPQRKRVT